MPQGGAINPKTGKRYNWVDPNRKQAQDDLAALDEQSALLRRQAAILRAREGLLDYVQFTMPDPEHPNDVTRSRYDATVFHSEIAKALEAVERGETQQLIFCMPPRHGKTELATKRFAAWCSGRHPEWDIAVASYSDTMAEDMGGDTRAILSSSHHKQVFPGYKLRRGGTSKSNIQTVEGGRLVFVGRGGSLTGRGMHVGLGDDLFKDHEEARSQAIRDSAWNWFTKVFMTRRMGRKLVILTMTRWHSDDIIGRITDDENPNYNAIEASKWKIIRLPAISEGAGDRLNRPEGEALWPARFDIEFLKSQQRLDPLGFASLYQQTPTVADGVLYRRENLQLYTPEQLPEILNFYCTSDHAVGVEQRNDPSCFGKGGVDRQGNLWLTDVWWKRAPTNVAVEGMLAMAGGEQRPILWWAEKGHISKSIGPFLYKRMEETGIYINLREVTPVGDKEQRSQSAAAMWALNKILMPKGAWWVDRAVNELMAFPNGNHDDFCDMLGLFGLGLRGQFKASAPREDKEKEAPKFGTLAWVKHNDKWAAEKARAARHGGF